ncbi:LysR family transcriptional regulator [Nguyenibacter vanlangensis]|uniref:LysR family transcriptional regulator n=1 Tax=Nguyenibacter vanlangensis TaxID=1216886 RepID=A0ABZ3D9P1_9PROT
MFDLDTFLMVANELSFSRAAVRLGISQPTVTRTIRRLEHLFSADLVERHSHGIQLTYAGEAVRQSAHLISQEMVDLSYLLDRINKRHIGTLKIGFFISLNSEYILPVLTRLFEHPELRISLMEAPLHRQISALRQKRIDVALIPMPLKAFDLSVNYEDLWKEHLSVVLPKEHGISVTNDISWEDLTGTQVILRTDGGDQWSADYVRALAQKAGHHLHSVEVSVSRESIVALVRAGLGAGVMSEFSAASFNTGDLSVLPLSGPFSEIQIVAAWLPENANPMVRLLLEEITQIMPARHTKP